MLIGDPGVGKTALVEGIAQLIVSPAAPPGLRGRALIGLDVGSLVAGTQYRGAFEERLTVGGCEAWEGHAMPCLLCCTMPCPEMQPLPVPTCPCSSPVLPPCLTPYQSLLNEVRMAAGRVILFIDELHMLMDAGRVEGGMNAGGANQQGTHQPWHAHVMTRHVPWHAACFAPGRCRLQPQVLVHLLPCMPAMPNCSSPAHVILWVQPTC